MWKICSGFGPDGITVLQIARISVGTWLRSQPASQRLWRLPRKALQDPNEAARLLFALRQLIARLVILNVLGMVKGNGLDTVYVTGLNDRISTVVVTRTFVSYYSNSFMMPQPLNAVRDKDIDTSEGPKMMVLSDILQPYSFDKIKGIKIVHTNKLANLLSIPNLLTQLRKSKF